MAKRKNRDGDIRSTVRDIANSHVRESRFKKKSKAALRKCWSTLNKPVIKFKQSPIEYVDTDFDDSSYVDTAEESQVKPTKMRAGMKGKKDDMLEKLRDVYKV